MVMSIPRAIKVLAKGRPEYLSHRNLDYIDFAKEYIEVVDRQGTEWAVQTRCLSTREVLNARSTKAEDQRDYEFSVWGYDFRLLDDENIHTNYVTLWDPLFEEDVVKLPFIKTQACLLLKILLI